MTLRKRQPVRLRLPEVLRITAEAADVRGRGRGGGVGGRQGSQVQTPPVGPRETVYAITARLQPSAATHQPADLSAAHRLRPISSPLSSSQLSSTSAALGTAQRRSEPIKKYSASLNIAVSHLGSSSAPLP